MNLLELDFNAALFNRVESFFLVRNFPSSGYKILDWISVVVFGVSAGGITSF